MAEEAGSVAGHMPGHRAAVIGQPVKHSLSPVLHRAAYAGLGFENWSYEPREVAPEDLPALLHEVASPARSAPVWEGLSVTMPHKQALAAHLDVVDPLAQAVGAVNTVVAQRSGTGEALLTGFNTDVAGIVGALRESAQHTDRHGRDISIRAQRAVVLGSGATACSALAALGELSAHSITVAARRHAGPGRALSAAHRMGLDVEAITWSPGDPDSDAEVARRLAGADIVISTLPAGAADVLGVPAADALTRAGGPCPGAVMLDVVYAPWPTTLADTWSGAGGAVAPGWLMLLHQAVPQVQLMTGQQPDIELMRTALLSALPASSIPTAL